MKKLYPHIDYNFGIVDHVTHRIGHFRFMTVIKANNGELLDVIENYQHPIVDESTTCMFSIEATNRFHIICQNYINQLIKNERTVEQP